MSTIQSVEKDITKIVKDLGYEIDKVNLVPSGRRELGEFQINDAFSLAKANHTNPREIAERIVAELKKDARFENLNIAGAGFINLSFSESFYLEFLKEIQKNIKNNIDLEPKKKIIIDYGGANVAKILHVGHLRSANIGEALKRLTRLLGMEVIGDVHLGDSGLQAGMVVSEMMERYPDLPCFKENYQGESFLLPITSEDLSEIYPEASKKAKEDENKMKLAQEITYQIQKGHLGYCTLWNQVKELSLIEIKKIYSDLNTTFELWEGELDSFQYIPGMLEYLKDKNLLEISEGATIMDIKKETDKKEMPPIILVTSNGASVYATTDLATIVGRMKRFSPDEIWYLADNRQELHFEQVFRASKKSNITTDETKLEFIGFGTMNGPDGKPFKTRDGGVMTLRDLINLVNEETRKRLNPMITDEEEQKEISKMIAIAALKYADFLPFRTTDYIFEPSKFADLEGKTGPYLLYSTIRMKSLLKKAKNEGYETYEIKKLKNETDKEVLESLLTMPKVLKKAYDTKSLNDIAEFLYKITSTYNKFYSENHILTSKDEELKTSWLALTDSVYKTNLLLLDILGIEVPEKM